MGMGRGSCLPSRGEHGPSFVRVAEAGSAGSRRVRDGREEERGEDTTVVKGGDLCFCFC
jgi:hypothetical protein